MCDLGDDRPAAVRRNLVRGLNAVLFTTAARFESFHVFDWRPLARAHPAWFGSDGVHPSIPAYRVRAKLLASFIRKTCVPKA